MKVLLGMPTVGKIPIKTVGSLLATVKKDVVDLMMVEGSLVYDARDEIAKHAVENDYDYILFADSDMIFSGDDLTKLLYHDADICSGLYLTRHGENRNVAYTKVMRRRIFPFRESRMIYDTLRSGYGEIAGIGLGFCLIKTSVIKSMLKRYKSLFEPQWGMGEDIAFCIRARKCGYKIMIDRDVKLGHIGETVYTAQTILNADCMQYNAGILEKNRKKGD